MYNFRCGVDVSIGKEVSRRIPCLYRMFLEILNIPLDIALDDNEKPRYGVNERCIYWRKYKGCNNSRDVDLVTTNVTSKDEEKVYEMILHGIEARMNGRIAVGTLGVIKISDEATQG